MCSWWERAVLGYLNLFSYGVYKGFKTLGVLLEALILKSPGSMQENKIFF